MEPRSQKMVANMANTRSVAPHLMMAVAVVHTRQNTSGWPSSNTKKKQPTAKAASAMNMEAKNKGSVFAKPAPGRTKKLNTAVRNIMPPPRPPRNR